MADYTYSGLSVDCTRDENEGAYIFTVNLEGVDVVISAQKIGLVEPRIEAARAASNQQQSQ